MRLPLAVLVALSLGVAQAAPRRVSTIPADADFYGPVSADGRLMPYGSNDDGNVYLYDLTTGAKRRLTNTASPGGPNGEPSERYGDASLAISPDGRQLAYSWHIGKEESLRLISLEGNGIQPPRVLLEEPDAQSMSPTGWSPDGKWVAFNLWWNGRPGSKAGIVSTLDGTVRVLKLTDRDANNVGSAYFSPTGQYVAYEHSPNDWNDRYVNIVATETFKDLSGDNKIDGSVVGWIKEGLAYTHRTAGSAALFVLPIDGAKPGEPRRLTPDLGEIEPLGVSAHGAFFYRPTPAGQVWRSTIVNVDFSTGRISGSRVALTPPKPESNIFPASWSRDGSRLALIEGPQPPRSIYVRMSGTGELRAVPPALASFQGADLSPDGRTIATIGTDKSRQRGLFLVDAQTGQPTLAAANAGLFLAWSADGSKLYFDRPIDDGAGDAAVVEHDVRSGAERELFRGSGRWAARMERAMSSGGKTIYFLTPPLALGQPQSLVARDVTSGKDTTLVRDRIIGPLTVSPGGQFVIAPIDSALSLVPTAGGVPRRVPLVGGMPAAILAWAPDGQSFLGRTIIGSDRTTWQASLWWVPLDGRAPRKIDVPVSAATSVIGPQGSAVAFVDRISPINPPAEFWAIETRR